MKTTTEIIELFLLQSDRLEIDTDDITNLDIDCYEINGNRFTITFTYIPSWSDRTRVETIEEDLLNFLTFIYNK
jgi:hypothetical protein